MKNILPKRVYIIYLVLIALSISILSTSIYSETVRKQKIRHNHELNALLKKQLKERKKLYKSILTPKKLIKILKKTIKLIRAGKLNTIHQQNVLLKEYGFNNHKNLNHSTIQLLLNLRYNNPKMFKYINKLRIILENESIKNLRFKQLIIEEENKLRKHAIDPFEEESENKKYREIIKKTLENSHWGNYIIYDVSGRLFTKIPSELFKLNVNILNFNKNLLTNIPKEIGKLKHLQKLLLDGNQLIELPSELGQLINLEELRLNGNFLISLPKEIKQVKKLKELHLGGNLLFDLPKEIYSLINLEKLYLWGNQLSKLPEDISNLKKLKILDLRSNSFNYNEIDKIKKLLPKCKIIF
ncbi:MAG: leucine-rich repeat domain-containing protein [Spirochaetota bacterium]|nr:leucine-rich repeat domain-containing protein [Spirochaetota bacterium]